MHRQGRLETEARRASQRSTKEQERGVASEEKKPRLPAASTDALEETSAPTNPNQTTNDLHKLADLVVGLACDDPLYILDCATRIRKLLSVKTNPPIDAVVQAVPRLINLLGLVSQPDPIRILLGTHQRRFRFSGTDDGGR